MPPIVDAILKVRPRGRSTKIVAIDGYGGSGKSELADRLAQQLGAVSVVRTDDFARPNVPGWEWERMREQVIRPLERDRPARYQRYDWHEDSPGEWLDVAVGGTVIIEGVSAMRQELGRYWDLAVWLDCPYEIRLQRGVERDGGSMRSQWTDVWMPEEDAYFRSQRPDRKADLIIDGTGPYEI